MGRTDGSRCGGKLLMDFSYIGTGYHGLAYQSDEPNTVEGHLFRALSLANVASDVLNNGYERCGRTDRDVHALHNYASFFPDPCPPNSPCSTVSLDEHGERPCYRINTFTKAINKHLPRGIRVNWVKHVPDDFSSRRNCTFRVYKYFFQLGSMDLSLIQDACRHFLGQHNFNQFCKTDNRNPKDSHGTIYSFEIERYNDLLCVATICGRAFLWHQVRCMMGVLFKVGEGIIPGLKVKWLLDHPEEAKFDYKMASAHGLILVNCGFDLDTSTVSSARNNAIYQVDNIASHSIVQQMLDDTIQTLGPLSLLAGESDPSKIT